MLDDTTACYRHPDRTAAVACQRCERPICTACMTPASVGFHCPECIRTGQQRVIRARDLSRAPIPVTIALLVANIGVFTIQGLVIGDPPATIQRWGLLFGPEVAAGEWWRVVTSGFLHANLLHIGFNMFALWIFGPVLEREIGSLRFALAYAGGLLGGAAAVVHFDYSSPTLGASGAVLGLAGALAAVLWARGVAITQTSFGGIFIINLVLPLLVGGISFWGHFGGIAGGFAAGWLLSWLPERFGRSMAAATAATAALCGALLVTALAV